MTPQQQAPIFLSREQHVDELMGFWRQKRIDRITDDVIFEEDERTVARAMYEPEDRPIDKAVAAIWSGYGCFILFGGLLFWEMVR